MRHTVEPMCIEAPCVPCYLVEWYRPELTVDELDRMANKLARCAATMCAEGSPVRVLITLAVRNDEVLFGVLTADSAQVVAEMCVRAGIPADRLSSACDARIAAHW